MGIEQRKTNRYVPRGNIFVACGNGDSRVGRLNDISRGGMAFEHITDTFDEIPQATYVRIFLSGEKFYLSEIPCRIVYDRPLDPHMLYPVSFVTRRCGLVFTKLSEKQAGLLDQFIEKHTRKGTI